MQNNYIFCVKLQDTHGNEIKWQPQPTVCERNLRPSRPQGLFLLSFGWLQESLLLTQRLLTRRAVAGTSRSYQWKPRLCCGCTHLLSGRLRRINRIMGIRTKGKTAENSASGWLCVDCKTTCVCVCCGLSQWCRLASQPEPEAYLEHTPWPPSLRECVGGRLLP